MEYSLLNLSKDKISLTKSGSGEWIANYGSIKTSTDTNIKISIKPEIEGIIFNKSVFSSCGCTTPKLEEQEDGSQLLKIHYSNKSKGTFTKTVKVTYQIGKKRESIIIKIKGTVN